jgi:hypothetical protein
MRMTIDRPNTMVSTITHPIGFDVLTYDGGAVQVVVRIEPEYNTYPHFMKALQTGERQAKVYLRILCRELSDRYGAKFHEPDEECVINCGEHFNFMHLDVKLDGTDPEELRDQVLEDEEFGDELRYGSLGIFEGN